MHRVGGDLGMVEVEYLRQDFEGEASRNTGHAFVYSGVITVFLHRLGFGIGVFEVFAVVDPHLGKEAGILRFLDTRQHRVLCQHVQRARRTGSL